MSHYDYQKKADDSLRVNTSKAINRYLMDLDGQSATGLYSLVLREVEPPLLLEVMKYNRQNQSKAAAMLGINRATLRKKLKYYDLL